MGIANTVEMFNGQGRRFDDSAQRSASNECVRLIRKLRWIGMDDEAERVLAQLSGWPFRPTETVMVRGDGLTLRWRQCLAFRSYRS
jgi:hypothetical protein